MRKFVRETAIVAIAAASVTAAQAVTVTVANDGDTYINKASTTNANKAWGGEFAGSSNKDNQIWLRFNGNAVKSGLGGGVLQSLTLQFSVQEANDSSHIDFYFNGNGSWLTDGADHTSQDAATTPYLTYNDSGQPGATNSRFLGSSTQIGSMDIATRAGVYFTNQSVSLTLAPQLLAAINSGSEFSIYAVSSNFNTGTVNGRLGIVFSEGVAGYRSNGFADADTAKLVATSAVPEPATVAALALGLLGVMRRRRK